MDELVPAFERTSGRTITIGYASSGGVRKRVLDGENVDVVITTQAVIADLIANAKVARDDAAVMARSPIGVAIRIGAAKPDISSVEAFKRVLRSAGSLAYADPSTGSPSANHFVQILERLDMAAELKPRTKLIGVRRRQCRRGLRRRGQW